MTTRLIGAGPIEMLKSTLMPRIYVTAPPNMHHETAFSKRIDYNATFEMKDDTTLVDEKVPTNTGCVLWFPNLGVQAMWRFGFIPFGSVSFAGFKGLVPNVPDSLSQLQYDSVLAVPYGLVVSNDQIRVGPNLAANFASTRLYNGTVFLVSDTTAVTATVLNGTFSISALSDTRDVSQTQEGAAYAAVDIVQAAVTSKEGLKDVRGKSGVVSVIGSDIQPTFTAPDNELTDLISADFETLVVGTGLLGPVDTQANSANMGVFFILSNIFVTPWKITATAPGPLETIAAGAIDESGVLDIMFNFVYLGVDAGAGITNVGLFRLDCEATHYFATCDSTGRVLYKTFNQHCDCGSHNMLRPPELRPLSYSCLFEPRLAWTGMKSSGKYVGTQIVMTTTLVNFNTNSTVPNFQQIVSADVNVRARSVNERGATGPMRVMRWDNMSAGQNLKLNGVCHAQCVPQGSLAPFVQSAAMFSEEAMNLNVLPWLAEIYNGHTPIKRNWTGDDYRDMLRDLVPGLSAETLIKWGETDGKLNNASEAAGIFSTLGQIGGGILGGMIGMPELGAQLGGMAGGLGDTVTGVTGQFGFQGAGGYAGAYPHGGVPYRDPMRGTGQFGALGQFGAGSRRPRDYM